MALRLLPFLVLIALPQTRAVRSETVRFAAAGCPDSVPSCSNFDKWISSQRNEGKCHHFATPRLKCSLGDVPTSTGFQIWRSGQACEAYYEEAFCLIRNTYRIPKVSSGRATSGGQCALPKLDIQDCRRVENATNAGDNSTLVKTLLDVGRRGPDEWVKIPSVKKALKAASGIVKAMALESLDGDSSVAAEKVTRDGLRLWHMLLSFCAQDKEILIEQARRSGSREELRHLERRATSEALEDCKAVTSLDLFAPNHPSWAAFKQKFKGFNDLRAFRAVGALDLDESSWRQLAILSGGDADATMMQLRSKLGELVRNAGDRGEKELELALDLSRTSLVGSVKPTGGKRRLTEMRVLRHLRDAVSKSVKKSALECALEEAAPLLRDTIKWVSGFDEIHSAAVRKLKAWGLEELCTKAGLSFPCTCEDLQLPPSCNPRGVSNNETEARDLGGGDNYCYYYSYWAEESEDKPETEAEKLQKKVNELEERNAELERENRELKAKLASADSWTRRRLS